MNKQTKKSVAPSNKVVATKRVSLSESEQEIIEKVRAEKWTPEKVKSFNNWQQPNETEMAYIEYIRKDKTDGNKNVSIGSEHDAKSKEYNVHELINEILQTSKDTSVVLHDIKSASGRIAYYSGNPQTNSEPTKEAEVYTIVDKLQVIIKQMNENFVTASESYRHLNKLV